MGEAGLSNHKFKATKPSAFFFLEGLERPILFSKTLRHILLGGCSLMSTIPCVLEEVYELRLEKRLEIP